MHGENAEWTSRRETRVVSVRLRHEDADLFDRRASAAGGKSSYLVALLRSRKTPEHDYRDVAAIAGATASIHILTNEMTKVRNEVTGGFGLMKQAFISTPERAAQSKAELDEACRVAKAIIREAEAAIARVEKAAAGPLSDLEEAMDVIRAGRA